MPLFNKFGIEINDDWVYVKDDEPIPAFRSVIVSLARWRSDREMLTSLQKAVGVVERNIYFQHLSSEQGLSGEFVRDIAQDGRGHLWFATQSGLNRYDGRKVVVYEHDAFVATSISQVGHWFRT